MLLLWFVACTKVTVSDPEPPQHPVSYTITPPVVDFGGPDVDSLAFQAVTITNTGDSDLVLLAGTAPDGVEADFHGIYSIGPGRSTAVDLVWVPIDTNALQGSLHLDLATDTDEQAVDVPLTGVGRGPVLSLSAQEIAFGEVSVGCDREFGLTISNSGNADLQIERVQLLGDSSITMRPVEAPMTLGPFKSFDVDLEFVPDKLLPAEGVVQIESDLGVTTIAVSGSGKADGESTLTFTVGEQKKMTVLWNVNAVAIPGAYSTHATRFVDSLETWFRTLQDEGASYRVGFLWDTTGEMDDTYIDDTLTPAQATDKAFDMLEAGAMTDNDQNFVTLLAALDAQEDWLFEDDTWADSKLSFIVVQRDVEQSGGLWTDYVRRAQEYKDDPEDVVFNAIAGPLPGGCGEGTEPFMGYSDAVDATGGVFLPLCEADWTDNMASLAIATAAGTSYFPLQGTVLVDSLEVRVDDQKQNVGWKYRSDLNAIEFDDDFYPTQGATVEVHYLHPTGCD